ncbi:SCO2584 family spore wall biosynthesis protein [Streptomyces halobius]|uniref:Uncharacterized protein n=1 Tax=Streptomyces halobius TaxID=2879846 RepID=A0ABY4MCB7_9ACTN|nr:hypothetical protein [Streptomyces halobius]UQA95421.1 hypothetical protein K9S39_29385 [Streptomyces halobius]
MPDDVGGQPFPDGEEPEEHRHGSHGNADEEFASVVFDEDFVRSARFREPSAVERLLAAAEARAEAEASRSGSGVGRDGTKGREDQDGPDPDADYDAYGEYGHGDYDDYGPRTPYGPYGGALRPYRGSARWHRPIAWVLAVVMGVGLVALAFVAVYRGASGRNQNPAPPPASSGVDTPSSAGADPPSAGGGEGVQKVRPGLLPSASAGSGRPTASAVPRAH